MKISEMKVGDRVSCRLFLAGASIRKTKGNPPKDFLTLEITDGVEQLDGKIWNYNSKLGIPELKKVYVFDGTIGEYAGKKQITVDTMERDTNQSVQDFSVSYESDAQLLQDQLHKRISSIGDKRLMNTVLTLYNRYGTRALEASSAKAVHHVGFGGNAAHTIEVFDYAVSIANNVYGMPVSLDLVKAGALLHDIGKIETYYIDGPSVNFTEDGTLLDHIIIGSTRIQQMAEELARTEDDPGYVKIASLLIHIVASHHGKQEYGSPVTPRFAEAYIVSAADGMSASMDVLRTANKKAVAEGKAVTDKLYTMNNSEHMLQSTVAEILK